MKKEKLLLKEAETLAKRAESWVDLSNAIFDQHTGLLAGQFPTKEQRRVFTQTIEYKKIRNLIADAREKFGLIEGLYPSGKLLVRMPKSLHASLRQEALNEGVSLNQLIVFKLTSKPVASEQKSAVREKRKRVA